MNKEVDTYKIFRQLEERSKRANPYTFYDKDELIDEILKLEDNWNELEEWLESNWKDTQDIWYVKIINKMNKIKDGNNVSDRD